MQQLFLSYRIIYSYFNLSSQMPEDFELPIWYNGLEMLLPATMHTTGFTNYFRITVNDVVIVFEADEERNYRAVVSPENMEQIHAVQPGILPVIAETLHDLFT
ncbi:hypothetical protein [Sediminibacterium ginsengisoli]|uniref:Uncharacterized protein n=1 Tax=Sediminibacterium ginsengisoli TaxID=413434 RepID=A0A1T4K9V4_9BACT|nr:hypothetical protein [Sediminibacterium ginsengisoli]SJZ39117.1 hypothetical protein SAMN04488132_101552 [Sediminibacterium ginsengisoli]